MSKNTTPPTLESRLRALHDDGPGPASGCRHGAECPWMDTLRSAAALGSAVGDAAGYARGRSDGDCAECEGWRTVAADAFKAIDAYARSIYPELPEHYGMPVDGVRKAVEHAYARGFNDAIGAACQATVKWMGTGDIRDALRDLKPAANTGNSGGG